MGFFALVGIAGEDDLDAPDSPIDASNSTDVTPLPAKTSRAASPKSIVLDIETSKQLRETLLAEIQTIKSGDDLADWAYKRLSAKNTLAEADARAVEKGYEAILVAIDDVAVLCGVNVSAANSAANPKHDVRSCKTFAKEKMVAPIRKEDRRRNKQHLAFVASQPCLVCQRAPGDAHHLKFAQRSALGRKVSDEFTVPLCRDHHQELHRHGDERSWWSNLKIAPLETAETLWRKTIADGQP